MSRLARALNMLLGRRPVAMQVGAICCDPAARKVLLVTSRDTGRWVIPKGWPMAGRSLSEAAAQEAWEEAGVRGRIEAREHGRFSYDKGQDRGFAVPVEVRVFLLSVQKLHDDFPEADQRKRRWFSPAEAARMVIEPELKTLLENLEDHDLQL
ncbi:NUDIX hydrolase [Paracoccus sp. R86501]|uniref:NUDIX hydrolase n=1 Tax=Paracoccus sp. R86501 TaxID=3101711 RepID=UPI00366E77DA